MCDHTLLLFHATRMQVQVAHHPFNLAPHVCVPSYRIPSADTTNIKRRHSRSSLTQLCLDSWIVWGARVFFEDSDILSQSVPRMVHPCHYCILC